ncbi:hypothetical protein QJQ45_012806 [Haematococcus lacustris]|nr:hypothetical protein QJQ45_012806 [Haematococcus lacustris]
MAEKIVVSVVDASGIRSVQTFSTPKTYQAVTGVLAKAFGVGYLVNGQGDTVTPDDPVAAGPYTYTVTGAQHLGQSTFRRGITQLEAEVEAYNKQVREDMARIQNELADIRRQMEDGGAGGPSLGKSTRDIAASLGLNGVRPYVGRRAKRQIPWVGSGPLMAQSSLPRQARVGTGPTTHDVLGGPQMSAISPETFDVNEDPSSGGEGSRRLAAGEGATPIATGTGGAKL